ncbi:hypothetical protein GQ42DRAFT_144183 [Ramicandelaber brevisporus]|nr:hypothetical protein GQ42DRAFT_144183 [Ramicandelaber brevisporus]
MTPPQPVSGAPGGAPAAHKYANLPDIDDGPDVFETPDKPRVPDFTSLDALSSSAATADSGADPYSLSGPSKGALQAAAAASGSSIEQEGVSLDSAMAKFRNAVGDTKTADSKGEIARHRRALYQRYVAQSGLLDAAEMEAYTSPSAMSLDNGSATSDVTVKGTRLKETPIQRLRRLLAEAQELEAEIKTASGEDSAKKSGSTVLVDGISATALMTSVTKLQLELGGLKDKTMSVTRQVPAELPSKDSLLNPAANVASVKSDAVDETVRPINASAAVVSDIEQRLVKLEKALGSKPVVEPLKPGLLESVAKLESQLQVLVQPLQIDALTRRAKALDAELDKLIVVAGKQAKVKASATESGAGLAAVTPSTSNTAAAGTAGSGDAAQNTQIDAQTAARINTIFNSLDKVDSVAALVPPLIERMHGLRLLHLEANAAAENIRKLSNDQTNVSADIKMLTGVCDQLRESLAQNSEIVHGNVASIEERIQRLTARIEQL